MRLNGWLLSVLYKRASFYRSGLMVGTLPLTPLRMSDADGRYFTDHQFLRRCRSVPQIFIPYLLDHRICGVEPLMDESLQRQFNNWPRYIFTLVPNHRTVLPHVHCSLMLSFYMGSISAHIANTTLHRELCPGPCERSFGSERSDPIPILRTNTDIPWCHADVIFVHCRPS